MATSPIYSWPEPDNTDLVKNGALAIRTLGDAIDTTMGTMVAKSILDAKGDIIAATAADTASRLAVGTEGQVLTATSAAATGLSWTTPSSGMTNPMTTTGDTIYSSSGSTPARRAIGTTGQVLTVSGGVPTWATPSSGASAWSRVANGTLSGSSITVSSLSSAEILISLDGFIQGGSSAPFVRVNNISTAGTYGVQNDEATQTAINLFGSKTSGGSAYCYIVAANTTATMKFAVANLYPQYINLTDAITSVVILPNGASGTWSGGTYEVWTR